jgi:hypothetical protein
MNDRENDRIRNPRPSPWWISPDGVKFIFLLLAALLVASVWSCASGTP